MTKSIAIDRRKPLAAEPRTGHNRWHPDIAPVVEVGEGEDVALETRDACDGHLTARSTAADFATLPVGAIHPLTGPVFVQGARQGDLLEVEFREITPEARAFSGIIPGLGYLRDVMTTPFLDLVVLGLIFLKYISDAFDESRRLLQSSGRVSAIRCPGSLCQAAQAVLDGAGGEG